MIFGARQARPSWLRRLAARAAASELHAFVVPGPEIPRAHAMDLEAAGLQITSTPRHANTLVLVGDLPESLRRAASVAYAQMPRPRAILAIGASESTPLPEPDVSVLLEQEAVAGGVAELRRVIAESAFALDTADYEADTVSTRTEYTCSMHPEIVEDEPGTCPKCGMELVPREVTGDENHDEEQEEEDGGSEVSEHEMEHEEQHEPDEENDTEEPEDGGEDEHGEMDHEEMDHGDMDFMSMIEMTEGTPRGSDGLQMEWVEAPFGPLFPGLPAGLELTLTLDGDTVALAEASSSAGRTSLESLSVPVDGLTGRFGAFDPLSPVAYRLLACLAGEDAASISVREEDELGRVGALERERAASHLNWLASFGYLIGDHRMSRSAGKLQLAVLRAETGEMARLHAEVESFIRRIRRTPLMRRRLEGVGCLGDHEAGLSGPVARSGGVAQDSRTDSEVYRSLGFEPVLRDGGDAFARIQVRLAEITQSLELVRAAGRLSVPELSEDITPSGSGAATVETPRGRATLRISAKEGEVRVAELHTPSTEHIALIETVAEGRELADALIGIASLDLSAWAVI